MHCKTQQQSCCCHPGLPGASADAPSSPLLPLITPHTAAHRNMEGYVRFSSSSPPANPQQQGNGNRRFSFQDSPSIDSTDSAYSQSPQQQQQAAGGTATQGAWRRSSAWSGSSGWSWPAPLQQLVQRWRAPAHPPQAAYQSNYMTLVPLSGEGGSTAERRGSPTGMNTQWRPTACASAPTQSARQAGRQAVSQSVRHARRHNQGVVVVDRVMCRHMG